MEVVRCWEEEGVTIPAPYERTIKVFLAPDRRDVSEITFSHAIIPVGSQTDEHIHDRPELIYVVNGRGVATCNGEPTPIEADMVLWVRAGERHQIRNTGNESLKLATVFVPAYTATANYDRCLTAARSSPENPARP